MTEKILGEGSKPRLFPLLTTFPAIKTDCFFLQLCNTLAVSLVYFFERINALQRELLPGGRVPLSTAGEKLLILMLTQLTEVQPATTGCPGLCEFSDNKGQTSRCLHLNLVSWRLYRKTWMGIIWSLIPVQLAAVHWFRSPFLERHYPIFQHSSHSWTRWSLSL